MKLLVIGHSVVDYIRTAGEKEVRKKPGGIFYTITALNNFKENQDKISLVTAMSEKDYILFSDEYEKSDEMNISKVESVPVVWLEINKYAERHEKYENINQNLTFTIKDINRFDGILINMITGFDITIQQLKNIRESYKGIIYFDVHTLSRGLDKNFARHFRIIPGFKDWAENLDIIQVNKNELKTLADFKTEEEIIIEVLNCGVKYLVLTLEDEGAKIFFKEDDLVKSVYVPAIRINVKNKVGCGDVFGAVFFYSYIKHKNINNALKTANTAAGCAASYDDSDKFRKLKTDVISKLN
jgi:hypothetical protein